MKDWSGLVKVVEAFGGNHNIVKRNQAARNSLLRQKLPIHIDKSPYIKFNSHLNEQEFCRLVWPELLLITAFIKTAIEMYPELVESITQT